MGTLPGKGSAQPFGIKFLIQLIANLALLQVWILFVYHCTLAWQYYRHNSPIIQKGSVTGFVQVRQEGYEGDKGRRLNICLLTFSLSLYRSHFPRFPELLIKCRTLFDAIVGLSKYQHVFIIVLRTCRTPADIILVFLVCRMQEVHSLYFSKCLH